MLQGFRLSPIIVRYIPKLSSQEMEHAMPVVHNTGSSSSVADDDDDTRVSVVTASGSKGADDDVVVPSIRRSFTPLICSIASQVVGQVVVVRSTRPAPC